MLNLIMTIIIATVLFLIAGFFVFIVLILSGLPYLIAKGRNWIRERLGKQLPKVNGNIKRKATPRLERQQRTMLSYLPKTQEEIETEQNPYADNEYSELYGYENSAVMDEEDGYD